MKKINSLIALLLFSAVLLAGEALNVTADARLSCASLTGCCGTEECSGSGVPSGCTLKCASGTTITCPVKTKQC